jgi:hypothetical protein
VQGPMGNLHLRGHSLLPGIMGGERRLFLQHQKHPKWRFLRVFLALTPRSGPNQLAQAWFSSAAGHHHLCHPRASARKHDTPICVANRKETPMGRPAWASLAPRHQGGAWDQPGQLFQVEFSLLQYVRATYEGEPDRCDFTCDGIRSHACYRSCVTTLQWHVCGCCAPCSLGHHHMLCRIEGLMTTCKSW